MSDSYLLQLNFFFYIMITRLCCIFYRSLDKFHNIKIIIHEAYEKPYFLNLQLWINANSTLKFPWIDTQKKPKLQTLHYGVNIQQKTIQFSPVIQ